MSNNYNKKLEVFQKFINNRYFRLKFIDDKLYLLDAHTNDIIIIANYEILGYKDEENKKWLYSDENKFLEKNFTNISSKVKKDVKIKYNSILDDLKSIINKYDSVKWLLENKKKYISNNNNYSIVEYVIITEYLQIK